MRAPILGLVGMVGLVAGCGRSLFHLPSERCVFDSDCSAGLRCVNQVCRDIWIPDGGPTGGNKRFGEPCDAGAECVSEICVGGPSGRFCTRNCATADAGCPASYACRSVPFPDGGSGGFTAVCTVPEPTLCQPCLPADAGSDGGTDGGVVVCSASGADLCLTSSVGSFCGRDCDFAPCPAGFECVDGLDSRGSHRQCVPKSGACNCAADSLGLLFPCRSQNRFGACPGQRECQLDGGRYEFGACDARPAQEEVCNGIDDDCSGAVDDFVPPECTKVVGSLICRGPQVCLGTAGVVCAARDPIPEVCNFQDDDCNGIADEPFVDAQGRYTTLAHCGGCNNNCLTIAHATSTRCEPTEATSAKCRVLRCAPGYFPFDDGRACLALPDTLCQPCLTDSHCVGPGSRCLLVDGERVCGRDCAPDSPYTSTCPSGYACSPVDGGVQCMPVTGTCSCRASTLGAVRSCAVDVCRGVSTCAFGPRGPSWSSCDVNTFNPEVCDGRDNNCDGRLDEGYRNPSTGKYEALEHCGFCNNDCSKYWSAALQHTTGMCDAVPARPVCAMGPCLTEAVGPVTYEWVDVNRLSGDGCECRRVLGNVAGDLPDREPSSGSAPSWVDENCDGVDGVVTDAIFVSATASAGGTGSRTAPLQTIGAGLEAMRSQGKRYVLVAQGIYRENVRLVDGDQLFGGYSSDFLKRDPLSHTAFIAGTTPTATAAAAVHAEGVGLGLRETVVAGFTILGVDVSSATPEGEDGPASIGVLLKDCGPALVLTSNDILGGRGGPGGRGSTGTQGYGRQTSPALNGAAGANSRFFGSGSCEPANHRLGGAAGVNSQCSSGNAAPGGGVVCPQYDWPTHQGLQQAYLSPPVGSRNGRGGWDWSFDTQSGSGCGHVTESGFPVRIQQHDGDDGRPGADGVGGFGGPGAPATARHGSVRGGRWVGSPWRAQSGVGGLSGDGGGGGGAGGGVMKFTTGCLGWEIGATGGGGGAGACGGAGGTAGGAGGASIALMVSWTSTSAGLPTIRLNRFQRGLGGSGGNGGFGGAGGLGGAAGFGGGADRWSSSFGGKGGEGGNGGPGGGGGGGSGGPSFAVLALNGDVQAIRATNVFLTPGSTDTGGPGGAGGSSPGPVTSTGGPGPRGAFADLLSLSTCSLGCPVQTTCDGNEVCVPN